MKANTLSTILVLTFLLAAEQHGSAQVLAPADWSNAFAMQATSAIKPGIIFSFNPQPEPPASNKPTLNLGNPNVPTIQVPDSSVSGGHMRILFAVDPRYTIAASGTPSDGVYQFFLRNSVAETLTVEFDVESESGGIPNEFSWIAFNPQPEPPAIFSIPGEDPGPDIGFEFDFISNSPATLQMRVLDPNGRALPFALVPEPGGGLLIVFAVMLLIGSAARPLKATNIGNFT